MLDPQRVGLNAASVGFLSRTGQKVDWSSFNKALQTDDSGVCNVSAEMRTPVDELHVMGGQRYGLEGNINLKTQERQERQMRGYPLRSFSANNPVIILPDKFGGLPLYTRNQTEYTNFCSSFTAPMSLPLQNDTVLLGREGYSVSNDSASKPFEELGFEMNMHKSHAAITYNEAMLQQRKYIMGKRDRQGLNVGQVTGGSKSEPSTIRGSGLALGIGAGGRPEFGENADAQALLQKSFENEGLFGDMAEETAFEMSKQQQMFARQVAIGKKGVLENNVSRRTQERIADQVILANPNMPEVGLLGQRNDPAVINERGPIKRVVYADRGKSGKAVSTTKGLYKTKSSSSKYNVVLSPKLKSTVGAERRRRKLLAAQGSGMASASGTGVEAAATRATAGLRNQVLPKKVSDRDDNQSLVTANQTPAKVPNKYLTGLSGQSLISTARASPIRSSPSDVYQQAMAGANARMNEIMARSGASIDD